MKKIPLTQGLFALVDDDDYEELSKFKWHASKGCNTYYSMRHSSIINGKRKTICMHREIMQTPKGMDTDHINGNGLDNRKENLRICNRTENNRNREKSKNNKSGYKGVDWSRGMKKWESRIRLGVKRMHLGYFDTKEEAYKAYCEAAKRHHGEFARY